MKITKISQEGVNLIKKYEGWSAKPYMCPARVATIGYGNTFYEDGTKVKMTDAPIDKERGEQLLRNSLVSFENYVDSYCIDSINQNQFDALVSFCYNLGPANLKSSTLLKKVNKNPDDATIANEFNKWVKAGGKTLQGLVKRRTEESELYFKK